MIALFKALIYDSIIAIIDNYKKSQKPVVFFWKTLTSNKKRPSSKKIIIGSFIRLHFRNLSIQSLECDHQYWILSK